MFTNDVQYMQQRITAYVSLTFPSPQTDQDIRI